MKIERKENSGLVEFGSLKCGDVFEDIDQHNVWMKTELTEYDNDCINCMSILFGSRGHLTDGTEVKHYPNAKLVLED
jgi:hypothetical protein